MKCKEIENGRSCPWEDCPDFDNDWCKNCASYEKEPVANQHTCPYYQGVCNVKTSFTSAAGPPIKEAYSKQASERRKL